MLNLQSPKASASVASAKRSISYTLAVDYVVTDTHVQIMIPRDIYEQEVSTHEGRTGKQLMSIRLLAQAQRGQDAATIRALDERTGTVQEIPLGSAISASFSLDAAGTVTYSMPVIAEGATQAG